jgi:hypothetical protein
VDTKNFEAFSRISLHVLVKLFETFPGYIDLDSNSLGIEAKPKDENETYEEIWESMDFAHDTVTWLQSEGFIEIRNTCFGGQFIGVRLTLKGLTLLGYAPLINEGDSKYRNLAEKAQNVLTEGARGTVVEVMKELFIGALKYLPQILT